MVEGCVKAPRRLFQTVGDVYLAPLLVVFRVYDFRRGGTGGLSSS